MGKSVSSGLMAYGLGLGFREKRFVWFQFKFYALKCSFIKVTLQKFKYSKKVRVLVFFSILLVLESSCFKKIKFKILL